MWRIQRCSINEWHGAAQRIWTALHVWRDSETVFSTPMAECQGPDFWLARATKNNEKNGLKLHSSSTVLNYKQALPMKMTSPTPVSVPVFSRITTAFFSHC
jgi:hypothetical protein